MITDMAGRPGRKSIFRHRPGKGEMALWAAFLFVVAIALSGCVEFERFRAEADSCASAIRLSWGLKYSSSKELSQITGFDVLRKKEGDSKFTKLTSSPIAPDSRSWTDTTAESGHRYFYRLLCHDPVKPVESEETAIFVFFNPAAAVSGLEVKWKEGQPELSWDSDDSRKYRVYCGTDPGNMRAVTEVSEPFFRDKAPSSFAMLYYRVVALSETEVPGEGKRVCESRGAEVSLRATLPENVSVSGLKSGEKTAQVIPPVKTVTPYSGRVEPPTMAGEASIREKSGKASKAGKSSSSCHQEPVSGLSITWNGGVPELRWAANDAARYKVLRGASISGLEQIAEISALSFRDKLPQEFSTLVYRLVAVSEKGEGAPCESTDTDITLSSIPPENITITGTLEGRDTNSFILQPGSPPPYRLSALCGAMTGSMKIMARKGIIDKIGVPAQPGHFEVDLSEQGTWEVVISSESGTSVCRFFVNIKADNTPPEMTLSAENVVPEVISDTFRVTGYLVDAGCLSVPVELKIDRYPGQVFDCAASANGVLGCQIPLKAGMNVITASATDCAGNKVSKKISVKYVTPEIPIISIISPSDGSPVFTEKITVTGTVTSSLPADQIKISAGTTKGTLSEENGSYSFVVSDIPVLMGASHITIMASTTFGDFPTTITVNRVKATGEEKPIIRLFSPYEGMAVSGNRIVVSGEVSCPTGVASVSINGLAADFFGNFQTVTFSKETELSPQGLSSYEIEVSASSRAGKTEILKTLVKADSTAPEILPGRQELVPAPAIVGVRENPYQVKGKIRDANLVSFTVNGQSRQVTPASDPGEWDFAFPFSLVRNQESPMVLEAIDGAGNKTSARFILKFVAGLNVEILSPRNGETLKTNLDSFPIEIRSRILGLAPTDKIFFFMDETQVTSVTRSGDVVFCNYSMPGHAASHKLVIRVTDDQGAEISSGTSEFFVENSSTDPVCLDRQEPAGQSSGAEPNGFVAFYFNRKVDPSKLKVTLRETVHGDDYKEAPKGTDLTNASKIEFQRIDRDLVEVPGNLSWLPEKMMAAFHPSRYLAYNADVFINVEYDGRELSRSSFRVRPLPTLIYGTISDAFMSPAGGINVEIPDLGRTSVSDSSGAYGFGFGDPASDPIPQGRHRIVFNAGLKNPRVGVSEAWISVVSGRLTSVQHTRLAPVDTTKPFTPVSSGLQSVSLAGDGLELDFSAANLLFPDGRPDGNIQATFLDFAHINYSSYPVHPAWVYAIQPMGIDVSGKISLKIRIPEYYGSYTYLDNVDTYCLIVGYDPESSKIVPIGLGEVNKNEKMIRSVKPFACKRLDYFGYVFTDPGRHRFYNDYLEGKINAEDAISGLVSP